VTVRWLDIDHFLFEEYKAVTSSLGIYRILFAAYLLIYLPLHLWVSTLPHSFFNPPVGLTLFFTSFPGPWFFLLFNTLAIIAAVFLLFGYRTRVASISFALLLLIGDYWAYSFGKIDHDIPLIFIPLVMQWAGWGNGYSMDAKRAVVGSGIEKATAAWPLALVAVMVGMAMMTAALPKASSGWLDPHSHAVRAHMLYNVFVTGRANWFAEHLLRIKSGVLWEFFDYTTVAIEAAFLVTVVRRQAFRVVSALACFFHLGIALTMEIAFVGNIIAYAAVADWSAFESQAGSVLRVWNRLLDGLSAPRILAFGALVAFIDLRFGNPLQLPQEWDPVGVVLCGLSAVVAAIFLFRCVFGWFRRPRGAVCSV